MKEHQTLTVSSASTIRWYITLIGQRMKRVLDAHLLPYDITPQQARIVGFVGSQQAQGRTIYQKDIEAAFELRGASVTSLMQGLERRGFIARQPDPEDERRKAIRVLPKGQALISEFEHVFHDIEATMIRGLSAEQRDVLEAALRVIAENLEA